MGLKAFINRIRNRIRDIAYRLNFNDNHAYLAEKIDETN